MLLLLMLLTFFSLEESSSGERLRGGSKVRLSTAPRGLRGREPGLLTQHHGNREAWIRTGCQFGFDFD